MKIEIGCENELWDDYESEADIEVSQALIDTVKVGMALLNGQDQFWMAEMFDYSIDWGQRMECSSLHVAKDHVQWSGYIKHTDVRLVSESITLADLEAAL